jgi:dihydrofolate synthase/folylpolyglutamate synthase
VGLLADKDAQGILRIMTDVVDDWHAVTIPGPRGRPAGELAALLRSVGVANAFAHEDTDRACRAILDQARVGDRIIVFGSFHIVAPVLAIQPWGAEFSPPHLREI